MPTPPHPPLDVPPVIVPPRPLPTWPPVVSAPSLPVYREPLLNLAELERFKNLLLFAQSTVEGYFSGKHRSPLVGASAEFADYKEYVPGDDVARIDWRVYGRQRRLFVRECQEETDMVVYLLVDTSASMRYTGEKRQPKFHLAAKIAAALAYLVIHQGDKAALGLFADKLTRFLPAGGTRRHLYQLVTELERVQPASTTGLAEALRECHAVFKKRGRLVVLSDFWTDLGPLLEALSQFVHRQFELLLLQVVDPDELFLPPQQAARFVDLETGEQVQADLEEIRPVYRRNMRQRVDNLAREAEALRIQHSLVDTREPYQAALEAYLGFRGKANRQFS